jgi:uncharacterized protein YlaN (UPF0358 family)
MIIIKSQDGQVIPVNDMEYLKVVYETVYLNHKNINYYFDLGEYETEERAKEVMKEIEERIKELHEYDVIKHMSYYQIGISTMSIDDLFKMLEGHKELAIYTMPKE